jgi:hypothetical protein
MTGMPGSLFKNITTSAPGVFQNTFNGAQHMMGYIPWYAFDGLVRNASPKTTDMWRNTFNNTQLVGECPAGTVQYITHYEGDDTTDYTLWNGKVACIDAKPMPINLSVPGDVYQYAYPNPIYLSYNTGWFTSDDGSTPLYNLYAIPQTYGKMFSGFYTGENATGDQIIAPDGRINDGYLTFTTETTTLYAAFSDLYMVTYDCGEGMGQAPGKTDIYTGQLFKAAANTCLRFGYKFDGWAVSDTNDVLDADVEYTWPYGESKTLTARWVGDTTVCDPGYYHRAADGICALCTIGSYCEGGTFTYDGYDHGIESCPLNETSFAGADEITDCGRVLHIGNNQLYLRSDRKTEHTLNVKVGNKVYYANMSTEDVPMTAGTVDSMKLNLNGTNYSVYDDSPRVPDIVP